MSTPAIANTPNEFIPCATWEKGYSSQAQFTAPIVTLDATYYYNQEVVVNGQTNLVEHSVEAQISVCYGGLDDLGDPNTILVLEKQTLVAHSEQDVKRLAEQWSCEQIGQIVRSLQDSHKYRYFNSTN